MNDVPDQARADEPRNVAGEVEIGIVGKRSLCRVAKNPASGEREQECRATWWQRTYFHFEVGACDERVLNRRVLDEVSASAVAGRLADVLDRVSAQKCT